MKSILIQRLTGEIYSFEELGIRVKTFNVSSPSYSHVVIDDVMRYGNISAGTTTGSRHIEMSIRAFASDRYDVILIRELIFEIFSSNEEFYIIDQRWESVRYLVKAEQFDPYLVNHVSVVDFSFQLTCAAGYGESIATTLEPFSYEEGNWSIGMNLANGEDIPFVFNTTSFKVFNASVIPILAEERPFYIRYKGTASSLKLTNLTTGQIFQLNRSISNSDVFVLYGPYPIVNGSSVFSQSNHGLIDLARGWNEFKLEGVSGAFEISFDTRFYY